MGRRAKRLTAKAQASADKEKVLKHAKTPQCLFPPLPAVHLLM
jgi:hypothetical protein